MSSDLEVAISHYHRLIADDLTAAESQLEELQQRQLDQRVTFGERAMAHSLRPTFLTEARYNSVQDTVYLIRQAILLIAANFFNDRYVLEAELGLEEWELELASMPTNVIRLSALSRMDSFLTTNSFKFVELNGESPAGIAYIHKLASIYEELAVFREFVKKHPVRFVSPMVHTLAALVQVYHEEFDGREERPTFAIVDNLDVPTIHEFNLLKAYFDRMGFPTEVVAPQDLECRDGWVYANGRRIDILYRRLLLNEFYAMKDDCKAFLDGYVAQKTCYLNSFRTKLVHKKSLFALLTNERYTSVLTAEQREAVRNHIPWTRMLRQEQTTFRGLRIDLLEFVRANRKYFVLKPNDEYGGKDVTLGFTASQSEWDAALERAVHGRYVVQEVVDIHREPFLMKTEADGATSWEMVPTIIDLDPYLNGPLMGGCLTRTSAGNLANVTAGGGTLPMFILRHTY